MDLSLKIKVEGPDILGKINISKVTCRNKNTFCTNEKACEILGQCILDHPLVKANKSASKAFKHKMHINQVVFIISKLMPSLQGAPYYKSIKRKQKNTKKI